MDTARIIHRIIAKTENQLDNPDFKSWFNGSKVVDSSGKPLLVYHGTNADFTVFKDNELKDGWLGKGIYFTPDKKLAKTFGRKVKSCYLKIKKPFIVNGNEPNDFVREVKLLSKSDNNNWNHDTLLSVLKKNGYDGVYFNHWDLGEMYTVFSANRIKSAIGNNGTFSSRSKDITSSLT